jgi:hypothetical protein
VLRTDTGNFNRFLTSLGLLLLAGALVIPYLYFRNTDILEIPDADLQRMTDTGRSALIGRQDAIAALEPWVIGGAILLATGGALLVIAGGLRLKAAQKSEDEETELRKNRAQLELDEMSPAERAEQVTEKAREEVAQEGRNVSTPGVDRSGWGLWTRQRAITRVSGRVKETFDLQRLLTHRPKWQVRIGEGAEAIRLEGVFESADEAHPDILLETRIALDPAVMGKLARNVANDLIAMLSRYQVATKRPAQGWLVFVVPDESEVSFAADALDRARASLQSAVGKFGGATVIQEEEIGSLPQLFEQQFSPPHPHVFWW